MPFEQEEGAPPNISSLVERCDDPEEARAQASRMLSLVDEWRRENGEVDATVADGVKTRIASWAD